MRNRLFPREFSGWIRCFPGFWRFVSCSPRAEEILSSKLPLDLEPHVGEADAPSRDDEGGDEDESQPGGKRLLFCGGQDLHCVVVPAPLVVFFIGSTVFPFRKVNVRFETPPKRRKESESATVRQDCSSQGDDLVPPPGATYAVSPEMKQFGRHLMAKVEARTRYHLQFGLLGFGCSCYFIFSGTVFLWKFPCQSVAPRVLRAVLNGASAFGDYSTQDERHTEEERCFVVFWEEEHLKKVCIGSEPLEQPVPYAEITPLSRFVCWFDSEKLPVPIVGVSPSLLRVFSDSCADGRRFVV